MKKRSVLIFLAGLFFITAHCQQTTDHKSASYYYNAIKSEAAPDQKEALLLKMLENAEETSGRPGGFNLVEYSKGLIATAYAEAGNTGKAKYWINEIKDEGTKLSATLGVSSALISANKLSEAEELILPILKKSEKEDINVMGRSQNNYITSLYGTILYKKGAYEKSLKYLALSSSILPHDHEMYALALVYAGNSDQAFKEMKELIFKPGERSPEFNEAAKEMFIKKYGNAKHYGQLCDSAAKIEQKRLYDKVSAFMLNEAAPDFTITDVNGKTVSRQSLHGKTIVMDFWATWCQPCVASLPAMQKIANYYKDDNSVVFMFIHTAEKNSNATEDAKKLWAHKHLNDLDMYMDLRDKTGKNPLMTSFKIRSLPTKLVIDKNGMLRFKSVGGGSMDEIVGEMKTIIDLVK